MNKPLITLLFLLLAGSFLSGTAQAQDEVDQDPASTNYTVGDLEKIDKLELTSIYAAKVKRLYDILPYIPFEKLEPKSPEDLKIPSTGANDKSMKNLKESRDEYKKTLTSTLNQITPYADKKKIIESILFVQTMINKVELIGLGMNELGY